MAWATRSRVSRSPQALWRRRRGCTAQGVARGGHPVGQGFAKADAHVVCSEHGCRGPGARAALTPRIDEPVAERTQGCPLSAETAPLRAGPRLASRACHATRCVRARPGDDAARSRDVARRARCVAASLKRYASAAHPPMARHRRGAVCERGTAPAGGGARRSARGRFASGCGSGRGASGRCFACDRRMGGRFWGVVE